MSRSQILVRLPVDLHKQLVQQAANQGVSLNQLVVALLAGGIGFKLGHPIERPGAAGTAPGMAQEV